MAKRTCTIDGCDRPVHARGWCNKHYLRWKTYGDPLHVKHVKVQGSLEERFWAKVDEQPGEGCWLWNAAQNEHGYGLFNFNGTTRTAHRVSWGFAGRELVDGLTLDHLCRVRHCVRPSHLEQVTSRENTLRGDTIAARHAAKTHCPQGHPYDDENTYVDPDGWRHCRACPRERLRRAS